MEKQECVVTFKNASRQIAMYFTEEDGNLDMQMSVNPEVADGEAPDLPLMLASAFLQLLNTENKDESESESPIIVN